jgi:hypothetical protein
MPISYLDTKNNIKSYIENNRLLNDIFNNIFIIAFLIISIILLIVSFNINATKNKITNYIKIFVYSLLGTIIVLTIHNKVIKYNYKQSSIMSRDREFTDIMEKNTFDLVNEKNIIGQLDSNSVSHNLHNNIIIEKDNDIERFLNI